ncbi:antA/AntB antirepressor family protein [Aquitalea sp. LB_tupeE]|uniref:antA/AntB antirepressor family protein n=1 Tax=Aquitalea sp. LB_tupeE TaxID=2748078 RepID=UPI0015BFD8B5|nr:antA/AntB antirepressor family protein [Aquitalea sp. LB_tupeE]NWK80326.1 antA/AntB antirepressor family protein [Aquitalea sp. LB_tupeE]
MQALIPVVDFQIGDALLPAVNARELHAFLQVGKDFSTWMKDRATQYKFIENKDFVCSPVSGSKVQGAHNRKDYMISLSMAKELAMVERNDKGRQARLYFIACEQRALQLAGAAALPVADAVPPGCARFNGAVVFTNQQLERLLAVCKDTLYSNRHLRPGRFRVGVEYFSLSGEPLRNFTLDNISTGVFTRRGGRKLTIWTLEGVEAHLAMLPPSIADPARLRLRQWLEGGGPAAPAAVPALAAPPSAQLAVPSDEAYLATLRFPSAAALGAAMPVILALMQQHGAELAGARVG